MLRENYLKSAADLSRKVENEDKRLVFLSFLRLFSFIGAVAFLLLGIFEGKTYMYLFFAIFLILFLFLLKFYALHSDKKVYLTRLAAVNRNEAAAVSGDLSAFDPGDKYHSADHDFSNDTDIFGNSSLFQYLNRSEDTRLNSSHSDRSRMPSSA